MIDLSALKSKLSLSTLEDKILDYYEQNGTFPYRILLNREQFETMLDVCGGNYVNLNFRGIPIQYKCAYKTIGEEKNDIKE